MIRGRIFISFRELDEKGRPTKDSEIAEEVSGFLSERGYEILSCKNVPKKQEIADYEKELEFTLGISDILIIVGTSSENLDTGWVQYARIIFGGFIERGSKFPGTMFSYVHNVVKQSIPLSLQKVPTIRHGPDSLKQLYNRIEVSMNYIAERKRTSRTKKETSFPEGARTNCHKCGRHPFSNEHVSFHYISAFPNKYSSYERYIKSSDIYVFLCHSCCEEIREKAVEKAHTPLDKGTTVLLMCSGVFITLLNQTFLCDFLEKVHYLLMVVVYLMGGLLICGSSYQFRLKWSDNKEINTRWGSYLFFLGSLLLLLCFVIRFPVVWDFVAFVIGWGILGIGFRLGNEGTPEDAKKKREKEIGDLAVSNAALELAKRTPQGIGARRIFTESEWY